MTNEILKTDVVVIGAGPVGLFALFECGMLKLKCHVFDALDATGGQCAALYPEKPIYDIPAHPQILGGDLAANLLTQAQPFHPVFHLGQQVVELKSLDETGTAFEVVGSNGTKVHCRSIIIAAGVGAFGPNRPPLDGIELYEGKTVHYYVKTKETYRDKHVVIAGGGDSAVDWAIVLSEIAASVSLVHRRTKFRAAPESESRLKALSDSGKIKLVVPYQLDSLTGEGGVLTEVGVATLAGDRLSLQADYLLAFFGLSMNLGPIAEWNLGLTNNNITIDPLTGATNQKGIYAIGDVATYPHKLKLILTGFAEAAQTAHAIRAHLYPNEIVHFEYSTTKGVPG